MNVVTRQTCRLCGSKALTPIISLGSQQLATSFVSDEKKDKIPTRKVPLDLVRCDPEADEYACGLVQLKHSFPADIMYSEYWYLSGVNQTMRDALKNIVEKISSMANLTEGDTIVDIGCNDGTLLNSYTTPGLDKVGFDPAKNLQNLTTDTFTRITDFFNAKSFKKIKGEKKVKAITSIAMFYDLEDPDSFVKEIAEILDTNGVWILQMADLPNMLINNMFDNICHEHLCYYHLSPMEYLLKKNGLRLIDIEKNDINGSSYRFYISKIEGLEISKEASERIDKIRFEEFNLGLDTPTPYEHFYECVLKNKHDLLFFLNQCKKDGKKVFVYGASTKGNVLLQYCEINTDLVEYAVERNPKKWGMKTIATNIPIISEEEARKKNPDFFLVLPYHFLDEMMDREQEFIKKGGKFIVPVPHIRLLPS